AVWASAPRCAVRSANARYSASSARGIEHLALTLGGEHVLPRACIVALRKPRGGVAHRVLERPRAQAGTLRLRTVDLHEARLLGERERAPQRKAGPRLDLLLDEDRLVHPGRRGRPGAGDTTQRFDDCAHRP